MGHNMTTMSEVPDINIFPFPLQHQPCYCQTWQACASNLLQNSNLYHLHNIPCVYSFPTDNVKDIGTDGNIVLKKDLKVWWKGVELIHMAHNRNQGYCEHGNLPSGSIKYANVRQAERLLASDDGLQYTELSFSVSLHTRLC
jgi:hypothetical protein